MTLLAIERVCKRHGDGRTERVVFKELSMSLHAGELVAVWGVRRSGRSTLLRIAAGIEPPDSGVVRFEGRELCARGGEALGRGIGYCKRALPPGDGRIVLDKLMVGPLTRGVAHSQARSRVRAALERVGAGECAPLPLKQLDGAEAVRVGLARALVLEPALLLIDEPVTGVDLLQRDDILKLLRSLAAEDGIAVLMSVGESTEFTHADRALKIGGGRLVGSVDPELASVHHLQHQATA
jgi:ABC-type multidrug transport system ATPase subunit